jgi:hypothetical protein
VGLHLLAGPLPRWAKRNNDDIPEREDGRAGVRLKLR